MATDLVNLETKVGPLVPGGDGVLNQYLRAGKTGELITAEAHARYYEAVSRGSVFCACNQAEITFGTGLTATAVTFTLYNPLGSPVNLVLLSCGITVRTATTAGHIVYAANVNPAAAIPATNTELVVRNAKLNGSAGYAKVYSVTTLPAAPVAVRVAGAAGVISATAGAAHLIRDYVEGSIILTPNTAVTVQGITIAGTGIIDMCWEEVPIAV